MRLLLLWSISLPAVGLLLGQCAAFTGAYNPRNDIRKTRSVLFLSSESTGSTEATLAPLPQPVGDILILDHLNINHEKGRHDWLNAFYFGFLGLAVDPRKEENYKAGKKTVWANAGAQQFHLPEGKPDAQVLDGLVVLVYPDLEVFQGRVEQVKDKLQGSQFAVQNTVDVDQGKALIVTDPWGSQFRLEQGSEQEHRDPRGLQPGAMSDCLAMRDLTIFTPATANLDGIARFYQHIFEAPILSIDNQQCVVSVGPRQTLTFERKEGIEAVSQHTDLRQEDVETPEGAPSFLSNYGPHVSMYVADLPTCYERADAWAWPMSILDLNDVLTISNKPLTTACSGAWILSIRNNLITE